jgi:hypothetical protein
LAFYTPFFHVVQAAIRKLLAARRLWQDKSIWAIVSAGTYLLSVNSATRHQKTTLTPVLPLRRDGSGVGARKSD